MGFSGAGILRAGSDALGGLVWLTLGFGFAAVNVADALGPSPSSLAADAAVGAVADAGRRAGFVGDFGRGFVKVDFGGALVEGFEAFVFAGAFATFFGCGFEVVAGECLDRRAGCVDFVFGLFEASSGARVETFRAFGCEAVVVSSEGFVLA